jgi:hypothetical protein
MVGKAQKSHGARSALYGGCSHGDSTDPLFPSRTQNTESYRINTYMRMYPKYAYNNKHSLRSNTKGHGDKTQ